MQIASFASRWSAFGSPVVRSRISLDECVSDFGRAIIVGKQRKPFGEFGLGLVIWVFVCSFLCHFLTFLVVLMGVMIVGITPFS